MQVRDFSKFGDAIGMPDLSALQMESYRAFLQPDCLPEDRAPEGLEGLFREFFPVRNADGSLTVEYLGYELVPPGAGLDTCRSLGMTYSMSLRARFRVVGAESVEEDVYVAELPCMLAGGEFVINGAERVVVAQIQRSPGVDFGEEAVLGGKRLQSCRFIPERGAWIEFTVTRRDTLQVRLGQSGRMPATWFLRAMLGATGSDAEILALFHAHEELDLSVARPAETEGFRLAGEIVNSDTGAVVAPAGAPLTRELMDALRASGMKKLLALRNVEDLLLINTVQADPCKSREEALRRIFLRLRPGVPASPERAAEFFASRFADPANYSLGKVGRFRINRKFGQKTPPDLLVLCVEDVVNAVRYLMALRARTGAPDDIDDLGNRVLSPVGRLLADALREGFARWRRSIVAALVKRGEETPSPRTVLAGRALAEAVETFFARSELSQVADQTNPLAALNHARRISALGPNGLNRKRAGFEVRDVHPSHYGRICPIETPEGANIGLIASLGIFARLDEYGFLVTPYQARKALPATTAVRYLRADEEGDAVLAPAARATGNGPVLARRGQDFIETAEAEVDYADVSPKQMLGVSASLIPFLEHDDANRALMGSNMQRQAVPLLCTERPLVATGMEAHVAAGSGMVVKASSEGVVTSVDASHIQIGEERYPLARFRRLSEGTSLTQKPLVREGDAVRAGQVIADGAATSGGELSLGRNVVVAFMMWDGYNFEDAIIVSDRLVQSGKYTSVHIEEFTCELRETRLGREEFTRDIPNVSERILSKLDARGFAAVGMRVEPGDILVGKVAPKTKSDLTPEDQLLREIFGKAGVDVSNESLSVPPGTEGIVVDVEHFRRKAHLPETEREAGRKEARRVSAEYNRRIAEEFKAMMRELETLPMVGDAGLPVAPANATDREIVSVEESFRFRLGAFDTSARSRARETYLRRHGRIARLKAERDYRLKELRVGDPLPVGVLEMVKIRVAVKRPLAPGDKLAGRHGNKGVIARCVPAEDMPFLADGTAVDMVLNPLGVPSRMNVGQILETHLGWAGMALGFRAVTPVFDGASEEDIRRCLAEAVLPENGKTVLHDGRTGEPFDQEVTVGCIYMMKLNHLVDDKVHARSTGPYSLITQQPLGGKARMGGQRLGEMEVWALEAYGAAHMLQEMLTVKSDDVEGRGRMYESIVKGGNTLEAGLPLSFDVLVHEVRGLGLDLRLESGGDDPPPARRSVFGESRGEAALAAAERR